MTSPMQMSRNRLLLAGGISENDIDGGGTNGIEEIERIREIAYGCAKSQIEFVFLLLYNLIRNNYCNGGDSNLVVKSWRPIGLYNAIAQYEKVHLYFN